MAQDLRRLLNSKNCPAGRVSQSGGDAARKGFFGSLGKIGELEFLNNSQLGGDVGKGLRSLAGISDSIRTGTGVLPTIFGDALANGTNAVLGATGLDAEQLNFAKTLNPAVANRALGQAEVIADRVSRGDFKFEDIPEFFSDIQAGEQLIRSIFTDKQTGQGSPEFDRCVSPYAVDLISFAPKFKFLFVMEIEFAAPYTEAQNNLAFVIKQSTRPNVSFEYDDVNYYNFRTKVVKRSSYDPMSMRFYDDNKNQAHLFYNTYLKAMSPISNIKHDQSVSQSNMYEESGMDFGAKPGGIATAGNPILSNAYSASIGPLLDNTKNVISRISLFHLYEYGRLYNRYDFYNPRILRLELDDLDMAETGNGSEVAFQFEYDGMFLQTKVDAQAYPLEAKTNAGAYPLRYIGGASTTGGDSVSQGQVGEATPNSDGQDNMLSQAVGSVTGVVDELAGLGNQLAGEATGAANRLVSNAFSSATNFAGSAIASASAVFTGPRKLS